MFFILVCVSTIIVLETRYNFVDNIFFQRMNFITRNYPIKMYILKWFIVITVLMKTFIMQNFIVNVTCSSEIDICAYIYHYTN